MLLVLAVSCRNNAYAILPYPPFIEHDNAGPSGILSGGNGTSSNPYLITSADDFEELSNLVNSGTLTETYDFKLLQDITISEQWTPIGQATADSYGNVTTTNAFSGVFDGNGQTITFQNVSITGNSDAAVGLFGVVSGEDTIIQNLTINGSISTDSGYAGLVAGVLTEGATINNVTTESTASITSSGDAAGFVGRIYGSGSITNSTNNATVTAIDDSWARAGGFINLAKFPEKDGAIVLSNLTNNGTITGMGGGTGGIAGDLVGVIADTLYNTGTITGNGMTGGITGGIEEGSSIRNAENSGEIKIKEITSGTVRCFGGIVGRITGNEDVVLSDVKNSGTIIYTETGNSSISYIGGIAGATYSPTTITAAENNAEINVPGANSIGGIIGATEGNTASLVINETKNNASITGNLYIGGIAGTASNAQITSATNDSSVEIKGHQGIGGIVGRFIYGSESTISNSPNTAKISIIENVTSADNIGGIVGTIDSGSLRIGNSDNSGIFDFTNVPTIENPTENTALQINKYYGGIIGNAKASSLEIISSDNNSDISGNQYTKIMGGLVGRFSGSSDNANLVISNSNNIGDVNGYMGLGGIIGSIEKANIAMTSVINNGSLKGNYSAGGIVGTINTSSGKIEYSENNGDISYGNPETNGGVGIGGFIGYLQSNITNLTIVNSKSTGNISGFSSMAHVGAFVGRGEKLQENNVTFSLCSVENTNLPSNMYFHGTSVTGCTYTNFTINGNSVE